ncbi:LysR family transcriptional regulator substrate-binding protein [Bradyrhizobium sp. 186]|uniref:LysR family transcriptional regulator substrate-binding protein n=1 Tax=Bradyrhizobium sp. 186 TaxID=2782654 RepID=UPI003211B9B5
MTSSIGFCTSISAGNLRATLTEFKNRHPRIELATVDRSRTQLATALRDGTADVLIVTGNIPLPDNNVRPLWSARKRELFNRRIVYLPYVERAALNGMCEELNDPRLIEAYARNYNEERQRLAASSTSTRVKLEAKRSRIESERQRNIDLARA